MRADPAAFRAAAARFATGVTVVASLGPDAAPVAMTANSFTTVSTRPPTVLVSLMPGRTFQAVKETGRYAVSVLAAQDLAVCSHFAGRAMAGRGPQASEALKAPGATDLVERDGFFVLPQALAQFACEVVRMIEVADHALFVAEVAWCRHSDGAPLAFHASRFRHGLGAEIRPVEVAAYPADAWAI
ncbi:flavin reductase family protein [Aquibium microcysteis]|uniref:flavin reductase family protein n=1 Tax=Aquibium microcysteis TaxID=675281 RepID=UPI00165D2576|nr:flavin reductase family protein [Aquibium microcysteis]